MITLETSKYVYYNYSEPVMCCMINLQVLFQNFIINIDIKLYFAHLFRIEQ